MLVILEKRDLVRLDRMPIDLSITQVDSVTEITRSPDQLDARRLRVI